MIRTAQQQRQLGGSALLRGSRLRERGVPGDQVHDHRSGDSAQKSGQTDAFLVAQNDAMTTDTSACVKAA